MALLVSNLKLFASRHEKAFSCVKTAFLWLLTIGLFALGILLTVIAVKGLL